MTGRELKEIISYVGHTQNSFGGWLFEHGICGRNGKAYSKKTIDAWVQGRRNIPKKIERIVYENTSYNKAIKEKIEILNSENALKIEIALKSATTEQLLSEIERRCSE